MKSVVLFPSTVLIEPTNKCNLGCTFCEANCTVNSHIDIHNLTPDELRIALSKINDLITNIVFQGDCEPTVNPLILELVKVARAFTQSIALVTNGTRLREKLNRELIKTGVNWFSISIDDHRPDIFNSLRLRADLDRLKNNLRNLISIRNNEKPDIHVAIHKIVFPHDTLETLKEFVYEFYLDFGVNQISFSPLVEMGDIKIKEWLKLRNQLESELIEEGIYINLREFGSYPYKTVNKYCGTNLLFINHKGYLSPCGLHQRDGKFFGNLLHESLDEIAQKPIFEDYHNYWLTKDYSRPIPDHCKDCYLLKGHYHRYTLNEGHNKGLEFLYHKELTDRLSVHQHEIFAKG